MEEVLSVSRSEVDVIGGILCDERQLLKERFRSLFTLRNLGGKGAIDYIVKAFKDTSALLKHELAYCLGQMQDKYAIPFLVDVLKDVNQEPMVRHEAAEALGAIGDTSCVNVLKEFSEDPIPEVAETCELAVKRLEWLQSNMSSDEWQMGEYLSVDPAPPDSSTDTVELRDILLNENLSLFKRYQAMFALRNIGTSEAISALVDGLSCPKSALFRHEIAFVFGQMQREECVPALIKTLETKDESEMVRHECAEALGSIGTDECIKVLRDYLKDNARVVRESCEVALDISEYENSGKLQYADALEKLRSVKKQ